MVEGTLFSGIAMNETAISLKDAWDAGLRFRVERQGGLLRVVEDAEADYRSDIEQVLLLVRLALESGREVRIGAR